MAIYSLENTDLLFLLSVFHWLRSTGLFVGKGEVDPCRSARWKSFGFLPVDPTGRAGVYRPGESWGASSGK